MKRGYSLKWRLARYCTECILADIHRMKVTGMSMWYTVGIPGNKIQKSMDKLNVPEGVSRRRNYQRIKKTYDRRGRLYKRTISDSMSQLVLDDEILPVSYLAFI